MRQVKTSVVSQKKGIVRGAEIVAGRVRRIYEITNGQFVRLINMAGKTHCFSLPSMQ